ncbi:hypothetical protein DM2_2241 [Halorubrum sp. DM2]|nr:hypothetical protein DM2_2241 [Halorubrum sp. DM2]
MICAYRSKTEEGSADGDAGPAGAFGTDTIRPTHYADSIVGVVARLDQV